MGNFEFRIGKVSLLENKKLTLEIKLFKFNHWR